MFISVFLCESSFFDPPLNSTNYGYEFKYGTEPYCTSKNQKKTYFLHIKNAYFFQGFKQVIPNMHMFSNFL